MKSSVNRRSLLRSAVAGTVVEPVFKVAEKSAGAGTQSSPAVNRYSAPSDLKITCLWRIAQLA